MKKEILVAIDGSMYSNQALSYLATLFKDQKNIHFRLCSMFTAGTSVMPSVADSRNSLIPDAGGDEQVKKEAIAKQLLHKASTKLNQAGIAPERIKISTHISGYNIAGTIQHVAAKGLVDSILVGRQGLNAITEMLMGSVSATLFQKCHNTPIWIIDGKVESKSFLVPVDGSPNSLNAIDHLSHILHSRQDIHIYLFHCSSLFTQRPQCNLELFHHKWDEEWCEKHLSNGDCLFNGPRQLLLEAGIPDSQIQILPETSGLEESQGIIREAKKQNCGTIVMGRRAAGMAKGLFGGVSDRAIKKVQNMALWIVG
jgi:nucleotide-binding universal stress UspA family protein